MADGTAFERDGGRIGQIDATLLEAHRIERQRLETGQPEHERDRMRELAIGEPAALGRILPGRPLRPEERRAPAGKPDLALEDRPRRRDEAAGEVFQATHGPLGELGADLLQTRQVMIAIGDQEVPPARPGSRYEVPGLARIERQRLFHHHMRAGLDRIPGVLVVQVMRRGHHDRVRLSRQERLVIFRSEGEAEMLAHALERLLAQAADAVENYLGPRSQSRDVILGGKPTGPDHGNSNLR